MPLDVKDEILFRMRFALLHAVDLAVQTRRNWFFEGIPGLGALWTELVDLPNRSIRTGRIFTFMGSGISKVRSTLRRRVARVLAISCIGMA